MRLNWNHRFTPKYVKNAQESTLGEQLKQEDIVLVLTDGDPVSYNDIDMLRAADMGVAFHGKPAATKAARARINHGDLTALLYLQGYHARDFKL